MSKGKDHKNEHAVALGKLGGHKGGEARRHALTPTERTKIAKEGASARWNSSKAKK